jgi:hypothetical protein
MELEILQEEAFERILYYQQRVTVAFELQKNVAGIQSDEGMVERVSMECHSETEVESGHLEEVTVYSTEKRHQTGNGTVWMKDCLRASPQTSIQSVHLRMTGIVFTHCQAFGCSRYSDEPFIHTGRPVDILLLQLVVFMFRPQYIL